VARGGTGTQAQVQRIHDWLLRLEQVRYAPQPAQQLGTLRRDQHPSLAPTYPRPVT
jgi:hypothetical protein